MPRAKDSSTKRAKSRKPAKNGAVRTRTFSGKDLAARILEVQDQQRRRIARDLHDITGQDLVAISMSLSTLLKLAETPGASLLEELDNCLRYVRKVEEDIRALSYGLHPPLLDELGFVSALGWYVDSFSKKSGAAVHLDVPTRIPRLQLEVEIVLFRVVQEGLAYVRHYSASSSISIQVVPKGNNLVLTIDGQRSGAKLLPRVSNEAHANSEVEIGIPSMRERLKQLSGSLKTTTGKRGTQIVARAPLLPRLPGATPSS